MITTKGKTFIIERSKWLRGVGPNSTLLNEDGDMCCLGQILKQCGIPDEQLESGSVPGDIELPDEVESIATRSDPSYNPSDTEHSFNMMGVNDDIGLSDSLREERLHELAEKAGFSLQFID